MTTSGILQLAAEFLVAAGTGALAFFTWRLARSTSKSVSELYEERRLNEKAVEASLRIAKTAEDELVAMKEQAIATKKLADETIRVEQVRWEPLLAARLNRVGLNAPTAVTLENVGQGPAIDCLYVVSVVDDMGLHAWFSCGPLNLLGGERKEIDALCKRAVEQVSIGVSDDTSLSANLRPLRRDFEISVRTFEGDQRVTTRVPLSRAFIGAEMPPAVLFHRPQGPSGGVDGREEAFVCRCTNGHVHRVLPHLATPEERFDPSDPDHTWLDWYKRMVRSVLPCLELPGKPNAREIGTQEL